jgi:hypothetical protein
MPASKLALRKVEYWLQVLNDNRDWHVAFLSYGELPNCTLHQSEVHCLLEMEQACRMLLGKTKYTASCEYF